MTRFFVFVFTLATPLLARAQSGVIEYQLSAPIPGADQPSVSTFTQYITYLFPFLLSIAAITALVVFILGSVQYILSAGNPNLVSAARERISNAVFGLLLAVFAVMMLETINPKLIELNFDLTLENLGTGPTSPPGAVDHLPGGRACSYDSQCDSGKCLPITEGSQDKSCAALVQECGTSNSCPEGYYCKRNPFTTIIIGAPEDMFTCQPI